MARINKKEYYDKLLKAIKDKNGKLLSVEYKDSQSKVEVVCEKGHKWGITPNHLFRGTWCPFCCGNYKKDLKYCQKLAIDHFGLCLSTEYINSTTLMKWRCAKEHEWETTSGAVSLGRWCRLCYYDTISDNKTKITIKTLRELAAQRGGKCNASEYKGQHVKLEWECSAGHTWESLVSNIRSGKWCPKCSSFLSERICRAYFEIIFGEKFPKCKPKWLKTDKGRMELDGYCEKLGIAFEHQGEQHYIENKMMSKNENELRSIQDRDRIKRIQCIENNVILIEIPALGVYTNIEDLESFIFLNLAKNNIFPKIKRPIPIDPQSYYISEDKIMMERMHQKAISKGGLLKSIAYTGIKSEYEWECSNGHQWTAVGSRILNEDKWCKECAMQKLFTKLRKPVLCTTNDKIYPSVTEAAKSLNVGRTRISQVLSGKSKHASGYKFKYYKP